MFGVDSIYGYLLVCISSCLTYEFGNWDGVAWDIVSSGG